MPRRPSLNTLTTSSAAPHKPLSFSSVSTKSINYRLLYDYYKTLQIFYNKSTIKKKNNLFLVIVEQRIDLE